MEGGKDELSDTFPTAKSQSSLVTLRSRRSFLQSSPKWAKRVRNSRMEKHFDRGWLKRVENQERRKKVEELVRVHWNMANRAAEVDRRLKNVASLGRLARGYSNLAVRDVRTGSSTSYSEIFPRFLRVQDIFCNSYEDSSNEMIYSKLRESLRRNRDSPQSG